MGIWQLLMAEILKTTWDRLIFPRWTRAGARTQATAVIIKKTYIILLQPWKLTWNLKISLWKRRFLLKPSFSGSMLNFAGCIQYLLSCSSSWNQWFRWTEKPRCLQCPPLMGPPFQGSRPRWTVYSWHVLDHWHGEQKGEIKYYDSWSKSLSQMAKYIHFHFLFGILCWFFFSVGWPS